MTSWIRDTAWSRRRRRRKLLKGTVIVRGLAFSDSRDIPISDNSVDFRLPIKDSQILPNGSPKPRPEQEQHHKRYRYTKQLVSFIFSRSKLTQKEDKRISSNISFNRYWGNQAHQDNFVPSAWAFIHVDVIAICYDRSKPETLHNAIYKWYPCVLWFAAGAPICLVGYLYPCNLGPRSNEGKQKTSKNENGRLVSTQEGEEAARQIGAVAYIEWTRGDQSRLAAMEALLWYGYYYRLYKPEIRHPDYSHFRRH
ncbi:hypothetical protein CPB86DRAFT_781709 [Serendipita vermifera]|nr:hypothetical protein CPB86DRAFT_781709 [Serendipita vermifera]